MQSIKETEIIVNKIETLSNMKTDEWLEKIQ